MTAGWQTMMLTQNAYILAALGVYLFFGLCYVCGLILNIGKWLNDHPNLDPLDVCLGFFFIVLYLVVVLPIWPCWIIGNQTRKVS